jgi:hypothetical protein
VKAKCRAQALRPVAQLLSEQPRIANATGRQRQRSGQRRFGIQPGLATPGLFGVEQLDLQPQRAPAFHAGLPGGNTARIGQRDQQAVGGLVVQAQAAAQLDGARQAQQAQRSQCRVGIATAAAGTPAAPAPGQRCRRFLVQVGHEGREQGASCEAGLLGHAAAALEDLHLQAQRGQFVGGGHAGEPGAHDRDAASHADTWGRRARAGRWAAVARGRLGRAMGLCILCGFCRGALALKRRSRQAKRL